MTFRAPAAAVLLSSFLALLPSPAAAEKPQRVALTGVQPVHGVAPSVASLLTDIISGSLGRSGKVEVLSERDIRSMLDFDRQKQLLGCTEDSSCLAEIGGALGAAWLVSGSVGKLGSSYHLNLSLTDTRKARTIARVTRQCEASEDALVEAAQQAARELLAAVRPPGEAGAVALAPAPDQAIAKEAESGAGPLPWIVTGAGAAMLATSGVFGFLTMQRYGELEQARGTLAPADYAARHASERDTLRTTGITADVLLGAGLLTTAAGIFLFVTSGSDGEADATALTLSAGREQVGVVARGSF